MPEELKKKWTHLKLFFKTPQKYKNFKTELTLLMPLLLIMLKNLKPDSLNLILESNSLNCFINENLFIYL
jgi:hypothetical protein